MHFESQILLCFGLVLMFLINQQILAISLEFTCARLFITDAGLNNFIDFVCLA